MFTIVLPLDSKYFTLCLKSASQALASVCAHSAASCCINYARRLWQRIIFYNMYSLNYDASLRSMQLILGFNVLLHLSAKIRSDPAAV